MATWVNYHLLAPLFSSSLAHRIWETIQADRFSDETKEARAAKHDGKDHPHGFRVYPNIVVQKLGGTKPQNISQLNSKRHGENYLLASVPPSWKSDPVRPPLHIESIFEYRFGGRPAVRHLTDGLRNFLQREQNRNNVGIRNKRTEWVDCICDELLLFAAEIQDLTAGWSAQAECRLNRNERYWLDPKRALQDTEFATACRNADWCDAIARRFANWLNARLTTEQTPMGDAEFLEWYSLMYKELMLTCEEWDTHG